MKEQSRWRQRLAGLQHLRHKYPGGSSWQPCQWGQRGGRGASLGVQGLHTPSAGGRCLIPGWEARSHMPQVRPGAAK